MRNFIFLFTLLFCFFSNAQQQLSNKSEIAVITCGSGEQLYSSFGHSALRVYDPLTGIDKVYNYGTFDFNKPNFYLNFVKGKLIYQLSTTSFDRFLMEYKYYKKWVKMQTLNLSSNQVQLIYNYLENNALKNNREYKYDFFYNNCATKIEDVIKTVLKDEVIFSNNHISSSKTHRDLIADYTKNKPWAKFGIDLALGSVIDKPVTKDQYKFLPDYVYQALNNATIITNNTPKPLVKTDILILKEEGKKYHTVITPLLLFTIICLLIIVVTYKNYKKNYRSKWLDFILFFITGSVGIIILLLWFATDHTATYKNLTILWAFAPNILVSFALLKANFPKWIKFYIYLLLLLLMVSILIWIAKIQVFNIAIAPIIVLLAVKYIFILKTENHQLNNLQN